jgi:hypothetical protein
MWRRVSSPYLRRTKRGDEMREPGAVVDWSGRSNGSGRDRGTKEDLSSLHLQCRQQAVATEAGERSSRQNNSSRCRSSSHRLVCYTSFCGYCEATYPRICNRAEPSCVDLNHNFGTKETTEQKLEEQNNYNTLKHTLTMNVTSVCHSGD